MSGAGNMFLVFKTNSSLNTDSIANQLISKFSSKLTIEGIMALSQSKDLDFDVKYYNPDGSSGMMCGNGGRCAVYFAKQVGFIDEGKNSTNFSMSGSKYNADFTERGIKLYFAYPKEVRQEQYIQVSQQAYIYDYFDVGTEHVCIDSDSLNVSNINDIDIDSFSEPIRYHDDFSPIGVNVNIYSKISDNQIQLRTYEKGVEAETGACGTGAISTALAAENKHNISFPVEIIPPSGKSLWIDKTDMNIVLEGPAEIVEEYELEI